MRPAEEDIFQLCTPEPQLSGRQSRFKESVFPRCGSRNRLLRLTVQLDHNLRKTSSGPSLTVSVTRLLGSLTGEPARPPVLSSERLLRASRIACVFGGPPGPALDPWKASWCAARLASKAAEVSSNVMASVVTSSGFGASPAWKANGCREDWPSGRHSCPSCLCGEVFL